MAGVVEYVFDADGALIYCYEYTGQRTYSLNAADVLWVWDECAWREPTEAESQEWVSRLIEARSKAPRVQKTWLPVVSNG